MSLIKRFTALLLALCLLTGMALAGFIPSGVTPGTGILTELLPAESTSTDLAEGTRTDLTPAETATPEPTPAETATPEPTPAETATPEPTPTETATPEPTPAETATPEPTPAETATPEPTPAETAAPEPTPTETATPEPTPAETAAPEPTPAETATPEPAPAEDAASNRIPAEMRLVQFDIGFANAYMVTLGSDVILIDCGNVRQDEAHTQIMLDILAEVGIKRISAHFITHFHDDHCGNITPINERFADENTLLCTPASDVPAAYQPLKYGQHRCFRDGDEMRFGDMVIKCVGPAQTRYEGRINNDSMNLLITYGSRRFYLSGDAIDTGTVIYNHKDEVANVDVLQFPHHGMAPFTAQEPSLAVLNPAIVIVPGSQAFKLKNYFFRNRKNPGMSPQFYSSADGNFMISTDGESLEVTTQMALSELVVNQ